MGLRISTRRRMPVAVVMTTKQTTSTDDGDVAKPDLIAVVGVQGKGQTDLADRFSTMFDRLLTADLMGPRIELVLIQNGSITILNNKGGDNIIAGVSFSDALDLLVIKVPHGYRQRFGEVDGVFVRLGLQLPVPKIGLSIIEQKENGADHQYHHSHQTDGQFGGQASAFKLKQTGVPFFCSGRFVFEMGHVNTSSWDFFPIQVQRLISGKFADCCHLPLFFCLPVLKNG